METNALQIEFIYKPWANYPSGYRLEDQVTAFFRDYALVTSKPDLIILVKGADKCPIIFLADLLAWGKRQGGRTGG